MKLRRMFTVVLALAVVVSLLAGIAYASCTVWLPLSGSTCKAPILSHIQTSTAPGGGHWYTSWGVVKPCNFDLVIETMVQNCASGHPFNSYVLRTYESGHVCGK